MDRHQVKGRLHNARGKVREVAGRILGNDEMERKGKLEQATGTAQAAYGDVRSDIDKIAK